MKRANSIVIRCVHLVIGHSPRHMSHRHLMCRHSIGMGIGVMMMLTGVNIASNSHEIANTIYIVNHMSVETFGSFLHGVGCVPFFIHVERFWKVWVKA